MTFRLLPLALVALIAACAEPARVDKMVPTDVARVAPGAPLAGALCVNQVKGGEETNPLWTSEVDSAGFRNALDQALASSGYGAARAADCRYDVDANLLGLAQPIAGFDMEVTANVNYSVVEVAGGAPYFQATVTTPFTADFTSAFLGVERLRMANEGAVRANIADFLRRLTAHAASNPPPGS